LLVAATVVAGVVLLALSIPLRYMTHGGEAEETKAPEPLQAEPSPT
jgi:hypothetical protein